MIEYESLIDEIDKLIEKCKFENGSLYENVSFPARAAYFISVAGVVFALCCVMVAI